MARVLSTPAQALLTGRFYANYHFEGVDWGGQPNGDGNSARCAIVGNCRSTPVGVFETRYPWRIVSYRLRRDSGGPGKHRGGLGTDRVMEVTAPKITQSVMMGRLKIQPWGLFGGQGGHNAGIFIKRPGDDRFRTFSGSERRGYLKIAAINDLQRQNSHLQKTN